MSPQDSRMKYREVTRQDRVVENRVESLPSEKAVSFMKQEYNYCVLFQFSLKAQFNTLALVFVPEMFITVISLRSL